MYTTSSSFSTPLTSPPLPRSPASIRANPDDSALRTALWFQPFCVRCRNCRRNLVNARIIFVGYLLD
ncbi:hypothetical protein DFH09DRAFT_1324635 [Mycena vulgaris]|nr:hypothetical protein DFH09DRAFT_1324635 [Mycena vulgaris]